MYNVPDRRETGTRSSIGSNGGWFCQRVKKLGSVITSIVKINAQIPQLVSTETKFWVKKVLSWCREGVNKNKLQAQNKQFIFPENLKSIIVHITQSFLILFLKTTYSGFKPALNLIIYAAPHSFAKHMSKISNFINFCHITYWNGSVFHDFLFSSELAEQQLCLQYVL